jgi:hypothetical protein
VGRGYEVTTFNRGLGGAGFGSQSDGGSVARSVGPRSNRPAVLGEHPAGRLDRAAGGSYPSMNAIISDVGVELPRQRNRGGLEGSPCLTQPKGLRREFSDLRPLVVGYAGRLPAPRSNWTSHRASTRPPRPTPCQKDECADDQRTREAPAPSQRIDRPSQETHSPEPNRSGIKPEHSVSAHGSGCERGERRETAGFADLAAAHGTLVWLPWTRVIGAPTAWLLPRESAVAVQKLAVDPCSSVGK